MTISVFHASPIANLSVFSPGTHFGSRDAAIERAMARKYDGLDMHLYEVKIEVANPLKIIDEGEAHKVEDLVAAVRCADQRALSRFAADEILRRAEAGNVEFALQRLGQAILGQGGYDALVYENQGEDDDSLAWVIFNPDQARIIGVEPISAPLPRP